MMLAVQQQPLVANVESDQPSFISYAGVSTTEYSTAQYCISEYSTVQSRLRSQGSWG